VGELIKKNDLINKYINRCKNMSLKKSGKMLGVGETKRTFDVE
jgi:hypothetical protein